MTMLTHRDCLTLKDFSDDEIRYLLSLAAELKKKKGAGIYDPQLQGKNICLIFEKTSTRTRCAFEVAAFDEGAGVTMLSNSQMGKKESLEDTAKVLSRYYDGIEFRGYKQTTVEALAEYADVPVWNGLTDEYHPTQVLADLLTIQEKINKPLHEIKFVYVGNIDSNMGNSLMIGAAKMGMEFVGLGPKECFTKTDLLNEVKKFAKNKITLTENHQEALLHADVIYTDVWVSMGEEEKFEERIKLLQSYQVNSALMEMSQNPNAIFMHCLPAFHDLNTIVGQTIHEKFGLTEMEVTDAVFRSDQSVVFDQAENRLHTIKALLIATLT